MQKLVVSENRLEYIKKLIDVFNVINDVKISRSELNLLLELMYNINNRLNIKIKEEALEKLTKKGLVFHTEEGPKVQDFLYTLFEAADKNDFKYEIIFKINVNS